MSRVAASLLLAAIIAFAMSGCCLRQERQPKYCSPYISQRGSFEVSKLPLDAGVDFDSDSIPSFEDSRQNLFDQLTTGLPVKIDLLQAACMAAQNSELADLIEAERHAVQCQDNDGRSNAIDMILQGESLEQRNKVAGAAAELFLGLVQVQLQRDLIEETKLKLAKLDETVLAADAAGFATADGKNEVAKGSLELRSAESELDAAEQKLMYQLNRLINFDSEKLVVLQPVHTLIPSSINIDVRHQTQLAETNRPGVVAIESAISNGAGSEAVYLLLSQFDPRLGIRFAPVAPKKKFVFRQLIEQFKLDEQPDATKETRNQQVKQILAGRKQEARVEAHDALLRLQRSLEKLAIANENIIRLNEREKQIRSKLEIDAKDSYLEMNRNWVELQQAKSDRIVAAIEHEKAKIKLLQSKGELVTQCGYHFLQPAKCNLVELPPVSAESQPALAEIQPTIGLLR